MKVEAFRAHKINSMPGDSHKDLTPGFVIGESSIGVEGILMYLILFEDFELPVAIYGKRLTIDKETKIQVELDKFQMDYLNNIPKGMFNLYEI